MAKFNKNGSDIIKARMTEIADSFIDTYEQTAINEFGRMIEDSPVGVNINGTEQGRYKGNWQIKRTLNNRFLAKKDKNLGRDFADQSIRGKLRNGRKLYIFNNSPYANVIEFGGYPDPVKKGTYIRGIGYVKRSSAGFSRQAPGGHVRKAITRFERRLVENLRKTIK